MESILEIRSLSKRFDELIAVNQVSFSIKPNEIFGLFGPNGAGKTTLINVILGFLKSDEGNLIFHPTLRNSGKIGYCPQENILYPQLTCMEQMQFIAGLFNVNGQKSKEKSRDLLEKLGLDEKRNTLAAKLSGGMKRRLNIALALVHDPELLILDEPEAGLDPQSRILVREFIHSLRQQMTIILTTHNMDEADRLVDRLAIMDNGKILRLDTAANLKAEITSPLLPGPSLEDVFIGLTGRNLRE